MNSAATDPASSEVVVVRRTRVFAATALLVAPAALVAAAVVAPQAQAAVVSFSCKFVAGSTPYTFDTSAKVVLTPSAPKPNQSVAASVKFNPGFKNGPVNLAKSTLYATLVFNAGGSSHSVTVSYVHGPVIAGSTYPLPPFVFKFKAKSGTNTIAVVSAKHWDKRFPTLYNTCQPTSGATLATFTAATTPTPTPTPTKASVTPTPTTTAPTPSTSSATPTSLTPSPSQSSSLAAAPADSGSNTGLLIGGIVAALALIGGGTAFVLNARKPKLRVRPSQTNTGGSP